jgi:hypothetical protein
MGREISRFGDSADALAPAGQSQFGVKLYYGLGAIENGVKDNGFSYFLLLFYNKC